MTMLEKPKKMRIYDACEKYHPNSFLMINCESEDENYNFYGEVVAYAPLKKKRPLTLMKWEWEKEGINGRCIVEDTIDILNGGSLLSEIYIDNQI